MATFMDFSIERNDNQLIVNLFTEDPCKKYQCSGVLLHPLEEEQKLMPTMLGRFCIWCVVYAVHLCRLWLGHFVDHSYH